MPSSTASAAATTTKAITGQGTMPTVRQSTPMNQSGKPEIERSPASTCASPR